MGTGIYINTAEMIDKARLFKAICADFFGMSVGTVDKKTRKREVVMCRQVSMYFAKKYTKLSLEQIGDVNGGKDHATVLHSVKTVNNLMDTDREFKMQFADLEKIIIESIMTARKEKIKSREGIRDRIHDILKIKEAVSMRVALHELINEL